MNRAKLLIVGALASSLIALMALAAPGTSNHGGPPPHPTTTTSSPGGGSVGSDFKQCENDDAAPHACIWSGSILQQNNAEYTEGMSVPQQLILNGLTGTSHSLSFQSQASKGGKHAFDYVTSFSQATAAAELLHPGAGLMTNVELCNGLNGATLTRCNALRVSANNVDVSAPDAMGFLEGHNIAASVTNYETLFGNRFVEIYATPGASPITGASLVFAGYTGSGDKEANYVLNWTSDSSDIMIRWAGHLAVGPDAVLGYGAGTGSSSISGGPYHWGLAGLDGGSLGNQANQIQGSDVNAVPASGTITILKDAVPNSLQDFSFSSPTLTPTSFSLDDDSGVAGADATLSHTQVFSSLAPGTYLISEGALSGWSLSADSSCSALGTGSSASIDITTRTATILLGVAGSVTCNFINDGLGKITIVKDAVPDSEQDFDFTSTGLSPATFSLDDDADGTLSSSHVFDNVPAGSYNVVESSIPGWNLSALSSCSAAGVGSSASINATDRNASITLGAGGDITCTFVNNGTGQLRVIKEVVNDSGGTAVAEDFSLHVKSDGVDVATSPQPGNASGTLYTLLAGTYDVSEDAFPGYDASFLGDCAQGGSVTIGPDEVKTCTIRNDDQQPHLILIKHVISDNGGTETASDWDLLVSAEDPEFTTVEGAESPGTMISVDAGPYSITESGPSGYDGNASADCSGSIALGETKTCTWTNDDQAPTLTVIKHVVNDHGGSASASDWTMVVSGPGEEEYTMPGAESPGVEFPLFANRAYTVSETGGPTGYELSVSGDCEVNLLPGESRTCTLTNDDVQPKLIVIKQVVNDDGGTLGSADFTIDVAGASASPSSFQGSDTPGTEVLLNAGEYAVSEPPSSTYSASYSQDCSGSIAVGQTKTCTVTNDDIQPKLIVIKEVTNNNGGELAPGDFTINVAGQSPSPASFAGNASGTDVFLDAGEYNVSEPASSAYLASYSADCSGSIGLGETKTCTVTNDDIQPKLVVIKNVMNDNGGTAVAGDFTIDVAGQSPSPASFVGDSAGTDVLLDVGSYSVSEPASSTYLASYSADCSGAIGLGETKTCVVTNDDIQPKLVVIKQVVNDNGGNLSSEDFTLSVSGQSPSPSSFAGNSSGIDVALNVGEYQVSEPASSSYSQSLSADCSGSIGLGETKTCVVTNDDVQPKLVVIKQVVNDNGGTLGAGDFLLSVLGPAANPSAFAGNQSGTEVLLNVGEYNVSEPASSSYAASYSAECSGIIALGETKTCTVTNDDIQPKLMVIKTVINDNGGTLLPADFTIDVNGEAPSPASFAGASAPGTEVLLNVGAYSVSEPGSSTYSASYSADCSGSVALGETKTCTVTNDDIQPKLIVIKTVINDNGGLLEPGNFTIIVSGEATPDSFPGNASGTQVLLNVGAYGVSEPASSAYAASYSADCSGSIELGETKTCTVTNDDIQPKLVVIKEVVNDNGGALAPGDFQINVTGVSANPASFPGAAAPGTEVLLDVGAYSVSEPASASYLASYSADCSGMIALGETKTCTVTNDDIQPKLVVIKTVTNDNGGTRAASDFVMSVAGASPSLSSFPGDELGTEVLLNVGAYSVSEPASTAYAASYSADCSGIIALGETKTCTVTNDDIQPKLMVIKTVINDNGGDQVPSDWTMSVSGVNVSQPSFSGDDQGTLVLVDAGSYSVSESSLPGGYAAIASADCSGTLLPGDEKTCTITNDDIAPELTVIKHVVNDNGGNLEASEWELSVEADNATPASFPGSEAGVLVTFDANSEYAVLETGPFGYLGSASTDCSGTMVPGEQRTCTWTNDDIAPELTVIKHVINDNGGTQLASDWTISVDGVAVSDEAFPGDESGVTVTLDANAPYGVTEDGPLGYAASFDPSCSGILQPGAKASCTIINDDIAPKLLVKKVVVNDDGGPQVPSDWTMLVDGPSVSLASFAGNATGTLVTMHAGTYAVNESLTPGGYAASFSADCSGSMIVGDEKTCTVTNDDIRPELVVIKHVVNDHGGSLEAADFTMNVNGVDASPATFAGNETGVLVTMAAGPYSADEDPTFGYAKSLGADCSGTMHVGDKKTCTITNDDIQPRLTVIKHVINDDGEAKVASDFTMLVSGTQVSQSSFPGSESPGVSLTLNAGPYSVDEAYDSGYAKTLSEGCNDTIGVGETRICVITNNDIGPTRTQGFWGQHTGFTIRILDDHLGGEMTIGSGADAKVIASEAELFGAFLSDIKKESDREKRDPVEQARMQLAQQMAAARLNCAAFGCNEETLDMLAEADDAYVGTDVAKIILYVGLVDAYNNSRDTMPITPTLGSWGKATAKDSRAIADIPFWDETLS